MDNDHPDQFVAQPGIVTHRFAHKVVNRACGFHARKTAARSYKSERLPMHRRVSTQARLLEQTKHTLAQQRGVSQSFYSNGPLTYARKIEKFRR